MQSQWLNEIANLGEFSSPAFSLVTNVMYMFNVVDHSDTTRLFNFLCIVLPTEIVLGETHYPHLKFIPGFPRVTVLQHTEGKS